MIIGEDKLTVWRGKIRTKDRGPGGPPTLPASQCPALWCSVPWPLAPVSGISWPGSVSDFSSLLVLPLRYQCGQALWFSGFSWTSPFLFPPHENHLAPRARLLFPAEWWPLALSLLEKARSKQRKVFKATFFSYSILMCPREAKVRECSKWRFIAE